MYYFECMFPATRTLFFCELLQEHLCIFLGNCRPGRARTPTDTNLVEQVPDQMPQEEPLLGLRPKKTTLEYTGAREVDSNKKIFGAHSESRMMLVHGSKVERQKLQPEKKIQKKTWRPSSHTPKKHGTDLHL